MRVAPSAFSARFISKPGFGRNLCRGQDKTSCRHLGLRRTVDRVIRSCRVKRSDAGGASERGADLIARTMCAIVLVCDERRRRNRRNTTSDWTLERKKRQRGGTTVQREPEKKVAMFGRFGVSRRKVGSKWHSWRTGTVIQICRECKDKRRKRSSDCRSDGNWLPSSNIPVRPRTSSFHRTVGSWRPRRPDH